MKGLYGDGVYDAEEAEFIAAVERWKRQTKRKFPMISEILRILRELGWRKAGGGGMGEAKEDAA